MGSTRSERRVVDDPAARARAAYYRRLLDQGQLEVELDPCAVGAKASREWRRKAALAYLSTLTHGPKP